MSSIVTGILTSTVGLLWNKTRDKTAEKLKDGDVTDAKIREIVVRELNDIKTKLDCISRKDLLSSYTFLQEGVDVLNAALNKSNLQQKALPNETKDDGGETSTMSSTVGSGVLNEVLKLSHAVGKIKLDSNKEFETAKKRFEDARRKATEAFCNEALSIKDRIFAAKLRIVSDILECLDSPDTAVASCLSFLKKLHSLPAIQQTVDVYINGGVKSLMSKAERVDNVKSVMLVNYVLFDYVSKFSGKNPALQCWPTVEIPDRNFHPICEWMLISQRKSMGKELDQHPGRVELDEEISPYDDCAAVNSRSEVVLASGGSVKVISTTGESKTVELPDPKEFDVTEHRVVAHAVDKNDKVYVIRRLERPTVHGDSYSLYELCILDENYNVINTCPLSFLREPPVKIKINQSNDIIIRAYYSPVVYICDHVGQLKHKFETTNCDHLPFLSISEKSEIITSHLLSQEVRIYTEEGNLKSTIKLPEDHMVRSVAFHHVLSEISVLTMNYNSDRSCFLLNYSESGELKTTTFVCKGFHRLGDIAITSHPSGPFVIVMPKSITFI